MTGRILMLEDMPSIAKYYASLLDKAGYDVRVVHTSQEFFPAYNARTPDLILLDIQLKGSDLNGVEVLRELKKRPDFRTEVIVLSSQASRSEVAEAMQLGARNYHEKGAEQFDRMKFLADVSQAIDLNRQTRRIHELQQHLLDNLLLGDSKVMKSVKEKILRFAESSINVLITGETGSGKGVAAELIHRHSHRLHMPFKAVNIQGLPESLIESELFGYKKGAFTGATEDKMGYFESANGGTLFVDEISSLSLANQIKILTVIEDQRVPVLGAAGEHHPVDVRIISATNNDLPAMIVKGEFRDDLYFRLAVGAIHMPPLRERGEDILLLMQRFLYEEAQHKNVSLDCNLRDIAEPLLTHNWPGNIREAKSLCQRVAVLHDKIDNDAVLKEFQIIKEQHEVIYNRVSMKDNPLLEILAIQDHKEAVEEFERRYLEHYIAKADGQKARAADIIGIDRTTLYKKIKKLGIEE